ncbi:GntR family transcriptional regulator [Streptomyces pakalii]|uniref:Winged helix-turn-helix domain-containing protein n=1 Tax=Streptomyces pakalii TaxID=3036494 RepID=A0ABT7DHV4_9ACTN|nr:winged helix-turn-helix domain-containing protein [Streptomyces pakalii]MDJ1644507.1 winged helix-turn-helix domain-containing protein [Streptomyces pakalii]
MKKLPKDSDTPPYRLVAQELRRQISSGRYAPGEQIPSSRDLEARYEIANMTARSALRLLRDEGWINTLPGRGNFVADTLPDQTAEPAPDAGQMPTREYVELSERLDDLTQKVDSLLSILQQLGGLTNNPQNPKS